MRMLTLAALLCLVLGCDRGPPVPGRDTTPKDTEGPTKAINSPIDAGTPRTPPATTPGATPATPAENNPTNPGTPRER